MPLSWDLGNLTFWNPLGLYRDCFYLICFNITIVCTLLESTWLDSTWQYSRLGTYRIDWTRLGTTGLDTTRRDTTWLSTCVMIKTRNMFCTEKDVDLLSQYLAESESIRTDRIRFRTESDSRRSGRKEFDFRNGKAFPLHQHMNAGPGTRLSSASWIPQLFSRKVQRSKHKNDCSHPSSTGAKRKGKGWGERCTSQEKGEIIFLYILSFTLCT